MKSLMHLSLFLLGVSLLIMATTPFVIEKKTLHAPTVTPIAPLTPVRTMAEWEEVQAIMISWIDSYKSVQREIIRHAQKECKVLVLSSDTNAVINHLDEFDIPMDSVQFISGFYNTAWIRDYGPWAVYHNDVDSLALVDWIYDREDRYYDDVSPALVANALQLPHYEAIEAPYDWIHAGGNTLRDGLGTFFSSNLVFESNPFKTESEIDTIVKLFLGAERYFKLPTLPYDKIHHLDMHACFLDEETILVGEYPEGIADGPQIEENLEIMRQIPTAFGNEYNIIRIPMPPNASGQYPDSVEYYRTYTNSIFVNKTILVPVYEEQYDTTALRIYEENLPGYNVVGIDCDVMADEYGAIHCITKLVGVEDPLWISHPKLRDTEDSMNDYPVMAIIKHRSGIADATLYYRQKGDLNYMPVNMALTNEAEAIWTAEIPAQLPGTTIEYYIQATANDGKEQVRPLVAPEGFFSFEIGIISADNAPHQSQQLSIQVYPNPASTSCTIRMEGYKKQKVTLLIYNSNGQEIWKREELMVSRVHDLPVDLEKWPAGRYILRISTENHQYSKPLVVI
jgi:agmatine deiminase